MSLQSWFYGHIAHWTEARPLSRCPGVRVLYLRVKRLNDAKWHGLSRLRDADGNHFTRHPFP
jgi:hypothetical protein